MTEQDRGHRQREAYTALERVGRALMAADPVALETALDRLIELDEAELYSGLISPLQRSVAQLRLDPTRPSIADEVCEVINALGPHPLAFSLQEVWPECREC